MPVCALAVLLGAVALAARHPVSALSHGSSPVGTPASLGGPLGALAGALAIATLAFGIYALPGISLRRKPPPEDQTLPERVRLELLDRLVIGALPVLLVGLIVLALVETGGGGRTHTENLQRRAPTGAPSSRPTVPAGATNHDGWIAAGAAAAAGLVLILGGMALRRRTGGPKSAESAAAASSETLTRLNQALDDLDQDPDPRRAVIRAYAAMEAEFGRVGLERHPWEAPREYLARALGALDVSRRSARRLTGLFEGAKFGEERVGEQTRREALIALRAVRDEVGGQP